jgi:hypothetical protein
LKTLTRTLSTGNTPEKDEAPRFQEKEQRFMNKKIALTLVSVVLILVAVYLLRSGLFKREIREPITITSYASLEKMSIDDLIARSDLIVMGRADSVHPSRWNTSDGTLPNDVTVETISSDMIIFTDVDFHISETLKGETNQSQLYIRIFGGEVGQDRMIISGEPSLEAGQAYLLFLSNDSGSTSKIEPDHFLITGAVQGVYQILDDKAVSVSDEWLLQDLIDYIRKSLP